ncbi:MAG: hypothetical protein E7485_06960 [Ruminococcaceae bacterium]|nr:hypothetical protein [Oscillospiraceae bacterium]
MKKLISLFMAVVMLFGIGAEAFAAYEGDKVHTYESAGCTIIYSITNEWTGNQQVSVSITNNSDETLRNWAIKFDNTGTISNIWNASVLENDGELCVIRNNGYNYEIIPNETIEFGFMQQGENLSLPENISLCSKTADSTASAEISYEIQNNWGEGFIAAVTIKNISDEPLEAWKLHFNGNFEISSIWNANLLYTEDSSFKVENDITTTPIAAGETKTFSFEGAIASGEEPVMSDFTLTSIVIDVNADSDDSGETGESSESGETGESDESGESGESNETGESDESGETGEKQEPTDPDESVETEEPVILCFGEYLADENALEVYWYSTVEGAVSVYENTNDNGWVKLADVTDEDSYKYEITEDFLVKYIKVKQETESGTIESEPFIVAYTEDGYVCTWLDTDEDGLPDYAEKIYGTDPENPDTDSDGLSDYDEIYTAGTSPLKYDTDEDGTNDADSDLDKDGLTNAQELELGTSPTSADTDGDTLSDYAELYETDTDPLKADTDGDTLSDSDDIALGLDPNDPETFGVPDAEYKVEQTISADSEVMERVNTDESPYELSLEITASGNVGTNLIAGNSIYSTITESDARLGGAVSLSYYGGDVEKVKLIYEVGEDYISNDGSEYAENCVDLQGIKRYNIFRYFEDINMLLPVATEFDVENNTLYAETDELGTYCVLDMEVLLQNFGVAPDGTQMETVMAEYYSAAEASEASLLTVSDETSEATDSSDASNGAEKYYVTFVFDIRDGRINEGQLDNLKAEVREFSETVYAEGRDIVIRLMTQDSSDFDGESYELIGECDNIEKLDEAMDTIKASKKQGVLGNYCVITDALGYVVEHSDSNNSNYVFTIYDQVDTMFEQNIADELMLNAAENGVDVSVITPAFEELTGFQKFITDDSRGVVIDSFSDFADDVYTHIFDEDYEQKYLPPDPQSAFDAILLTGYERITLDSILYPNGENPTGVDSDTDKDTLTDWDEVDVERWETAGLITIEDNGYINLPTLQQCMDYTELSYVKEGLNRFLGAYNVTNLLGDIRVLPISSDPTSEDGDGDGYIDTIDEDRLIPYNPFDVVEIFFTPLFLLNDDATICTIKLKNGDVIWRVWFNAKTDEVVEYYITDETKEKLNKYYNEPNPYWEHYYWWQKDYQTNMSMRYIIDNTKKQKNQLDKHMSKFGWDISEDSDEYYGLWLYFIELRIAYDEAGLLVRDLGYMIPDIISLGGIAFELVDTVRQYVSLKKFIKAVGVEEFTTLKPLIMEYGDDAVNAWKYFSKNSDYALKHTYGNINATEPSLPLHSKPIGNCEVDTSDSIGIINQKNSAQSLADMGYKVEILEENSNGGNGYGITPGSNPDFLIEGRAYDCYSPMTANVNTICKELAEKSKTQATRIVLNLDGNSEGSISQGNLNNILSTILRKLQPDQHLSRIDELFVLYQGEILWYYVR